MPLWTEIERALPATRQSVERAAARAGRGLELFALREEALHGLALAQAARIATPAEIDAKLELARARLGALLPDCRHPPQEIVADMLARYAGGLRRMGGFWPGRWPDASWVFLQNMRQGDDLAPDAWACRAVILGPPPTEKDHAEAHTPAYQLWLRMHEALHHAADIPVASFVTEEGIRYLSARYMDVDMGAPDRILPSSKVFLRYHAALGGAGMLPYLATGRLSTVAHPGLRRALAVVQLCEAAAFARAKTEDMYRRQFNEPAWFDAVNLDGLLDLFELAEDQAATDRVLEMAIATLSAAAQSGAPVEPALAEVRRAELAEHQRLRAAFRPLGDLDPFLAYLAELRYPARAASVVEWIEEPTPQAVLYPVALKELLQRETGLEIDARILRHRAPRLPSWFADQLCGKQCARCEFQPTAEEDLFALLRGAASRQV